MSAVFVGMHCQVLVAVKLIRTHIDEFVATSITRPSGFFVRMSDEIF